MSTPNRFFLKISFLSLVFTTLLALILLYTAVLPTYQVQTNSVAGSLTFFNAIQYWPFVYIYLLVTVLTLLYSFAYNSQTLLNFKLYVLVILLAGGVLFFANSLILFFFAYETLLIPSFLILYNYAKTRKSVEAAFLMFFWTQFGALFLIFNFQYLFFITGSLSFTVLSACTLAPFECSFLFWTLLIGFGVKFPIWPFYDWLPKAHVEAPTNFSVFLSGVLVKFAFFGFIKYLSVLGLDITPLAVYPFLFIGFVDASSKLYYQVDLKKLVAYSTVIEMHWLVIAVISGSTFFWLAGFAMMIAHALVSANFFLLVDSITRRFKTRLVTELSGLCYLTPNLYFITLVMLIVFLGFPGSLLFVSEFMFFSALLDLNFPLFFILFFFAYFFAPSCFFRSWFLVLFGFTNSKTLDIKSDLSLFELLVTWSIVLLLFWLGVTFQFWV